jgi:hypothetical protein
MLAAAAETDDLKAVVSEGAGARAYSDTIDEMEVDGVGGSGKLLNAAGTAVKTGALTVFTNETPPANLSDLVDGITPRPVMFIAAPNSKHGENLNRRYFAAAQEPKTLWEIPESKHTGGIDARPAEYERRVVGFFDDALL